MIGAARVARSASIAQDLYYDDTKESHGKGGVLYAYWVAMYTAGQGAVKWVLYAEDCRVDANINISANDMQMSACADRKVAAKKKPF